MKTISRKTIFKKANVLFITIILVLTAIFVFTPMIKVVKAPPTTIFSEGFEGWVPGSGSTWPPAGWGVYDNDGNGQTWLLANWGSTYTHSGSGSCYTYDYMAEDNWLISDQITVPGGGGSGFGLWDTGWWGTGHTMQLWFCPTGNTTSDFLAYGLVLGSITVSGTYWAWEHDWVSTTSIAGQTGWFAIRDNTQSDVYDYLWIDDITFPDNTTQGFEIIPGHFPGWTSVTVAGTDSNNKWEGSQYSTYPPYASPHSGSYMALYYSYLLNQGCSARLQMNNPIDLSSYGYSNLRGSLWIYHDTGYSGNLDQVQFQISLDGITWTTLATFYRYDGTTGWKQHFVDLSAYASETTVYLGFLGVSYYGNNMCIDDVKITSNNLGNDYEVTSINSPVTSNASGAITPEVTVTNLGSESEAGITVNMTIEKNLPSGGTVLEYNQMVSADFDPNQVKVIIFPDWTPADWQLVENVDIQYTVCACVQSPADPNQSNDCICEFVTLHYPYLHDVGVLSIDSPNGTVPPSAQPVTITIKNYGQYPESNFPVEVEIDNGTTTIYSMTIVMDVIQPGETKTLAFPEITIIDEGEYNFTACTQLSIDTNPGNDCLTETVYSEVNNHPPVAVPDPVYNVFWGSNTTLNVLANDYDPDGDPVYIESITSTPLCGVATIVPGGIKYTHTANTTNVQAETIYYQISDGSLTTTANVSILITGLELVSLNLDPADSHAIKVEIRNHYNFSLEGMTRVWLLWRFTIDPAPGAYLATPPGPGVPNIYGLDDLLPYASNNLLPICTYLGQTVTQNCKVDGDACFTLKLSVPAPIDEGSGNFLYCDKIVTGCVSESGLYLS